MEILANKPVIISSSLTGLLISLSLTKARIKHVLVGGDEPDENPRLGESMNETASIDCWRWLNPEMRDCFYIKSHISLLNGDLATMIQIGNPNRTLDVSRFSGEKTKFSMFFNSFVHTDRIRLDKFLYHEATTSQYCTFVHDVRTRIIYDEPSDTVTAIELTNKQIIQQPAYVFDATGPFGLVAQSAQVGKRQLSGPERVVWTHYFREPGDDPQKLWWLHGTNLLRLEKARDGIDGMAWLIPLGDTLSIGLSVDATNNPERISKEDLIETLNRAFEKRGITYRSLYPKTKPIMNITHQYFIRERAYGKNWLLAGAGYLQIWFPSSSGVWTSLVAAHLAPQLLQDAGATGKYYEDTLKPLLAFHDHIHQMVKGEPYTDHYQAYEFWSRWVAFIPARLADHLQISNNELHSTRLQYRLFKTFSKLFLKFGLVQLFALGFALTRSQKPPSLSGQGRAFKGYFKANRFILRNHIFGYPIYLWSKLFGQKQRKLARSTVTLGKEVKLE